MTGLDPRTPIDDLQRLSFELRGIRERLEILEAPSGTSAYQTVKKLEALVENIQTELDQYMASRYTNAQINAMIASPGNISPGNVNSSGSVSAAGNVSASGQVSGGSFSTGGTAYVGGVISSPGTRVNPISTFRTVVSDDAGNFGYSSSARSTKTNISKLDIAEETIVSIEPKIFQMVRDVESDEIGPDLAPWQMGFIADDFVDAGLPEFAFFGPEGDVEGLNYDRLVVPLWVQVQRLTADRDKMIERLTRLEGLSG